MSKMIYCHCPKCKSRTHNYVREGAKKERSMQCWECGTKFKVNIKDFVKE